MGLKQKIRGICELYQQDPERADALVFGRAPDTGRRGFLKGAGLATMSALVGGYVVHHRQMPAGLIPAALAEETGAFEISGKEGLRILRPARQRRDAGPSPGPHGDPDRPLLRTQ